jgi:hypothetical protein
LFSALSKTLQRKIASGKRKKMIGFAQQKKQKKHWRSRVSIPVPADDALYRLSHIPLLIEPTNYCVIIHRFWCFSEASEEEEMNLETTLQF